MRKINVCQILPYFPPHTGGLETVASEFSKFYSQFGYGKVINVFSSIGQETIFDNKINIIFDDKNNKIGYIENGIENYILPSKDIIKGFPMPIFKYQTKYILKLLKQKNIDIIQTHTRFFFQSFLGNFLAKKIGSKHFHVEHGSDFVDIGSKYKNLVSRIYDKSFGVYTLKNADGVISISQACQNFVKKLSGKDSEVIYRGVDFENSEIEIDLKEKFGDKIIVGYIGRLAKWKNVNSLIKAYQNLEKNIQDKIQLVIVGDGDEFDNLKKLDAENQIFFAGNKKSNIALGYQSQFDIHVHCSNPGGGLATTLLQAMNFGCLILATPNEGAKEVIENLKNGILLNSGSIENIRNGILESLKNIDKKQNFSEKNKIILEKNFCREKNIKQYYNLYISSLGNKKY